MSNPVAARLRAYGTGSRIVGVDLARGLAVLGMYGAHVGVTVDFDWSRPGTWLAVVDGRSSILFALLAGVSIAIISGGTRAQTPVDLQRARLRILVRAALIFIIGMALVGLDTGIAVILPVYAVLFVAMLPVLRWRARTLFVAAGVVAVAAPVVVALLLEVIPKSDDTLNLFVTGHYPALIWLAFVLAGLGVGRLDLTLRAVQLRLLAAGAGLAVLGYGLGVAAHHASRGSASTLVRVLATTEPHSGSPFEVVGSTGFALGVLALCLLVPLAARRWLYPLAAVGSMALTAYTVHVVIVSGIGRSAFSEPDNGLYLRFVVGALVLCALWALLLGRGPLERLLTGTSRLVARGVADR